MSDGLLASAARAAALDRTAGYGESYRRLVTFGLTFRVVAIIPRHQRGTVILLLDDDVPTIGANELRRAAWRIDLLHSGE